MTNYIEVLKEQSVILNDAKAMNTAKKSAGNIAAAVGFYSELNGKIRDKEEVKASVAKDAPCNAAKGAVSKGKTLAQFFLNGGEVTVTSEGQGEVVYSKDSFSGTSLENLPNVVFSTLYTYLKRAEKSEKEQSQLERDATIIMEEEHNMPLHEIQATLGEAFDEAFQEAFNQAKANLATSEAAKLSNLKAEIAALDDGQQDCLLAWLNYKLSTNTESEAETKAA